VAASSLAVPQVGTVTWTSVLSLERGRGCNYAEEPSEATGRSDAAAPNSGEASSTLGETAYGTPPSWPAA
jgi:hypothetical protein